MKTIEETAKEHARDNNDCYRDDQSSGLRDGFIAGAKFAQRWIPVEEELPEIPENDYGSKKVLAKTNFGRLDLLRYTRYNGWQVLILNGETVTHWRTINIE